MDNMLRTIHALIESNVLIYTNDPCARKKVFQIVKHVTGKSKSDHTDYAINNTNDWNGYQTVTIAGKLGYIRVALTPLFEEVA